MTPPPTEADGSIGSAFVQVAEDARAYAAAQVDLYKAMATARMRAAKVGLILGAVAAVLAIAAVIGLILGVILSVATLVGPLLATVIVIGIVLILVAILGRMAASRLTRAFGEMA